MTLKIRQSYHGNGGIEGYRYKVYDASGKLLGELTDLPITFTKGDTLYLNNELYIVQDEYDSPLKHEEMSEVVYYDLFLYEFKLTHYLSYQIKTK